MMYASFLRTIRVSFHIPSGLESQFVVDRIYFLYYILQLFAATATTQLQRALNLNFSNILLKRLDSKSN